MEIRDLQLVAQLAELGSLTRVARDVGVNPSTLSRRVTALEDELGVVLFERGRRGIKTTQAGLTVVRLARRAISEVEAIRHVAARSSLAFTGELRLAVQTASLGPRLRAIVSAWRSIHPGVNLELFEVDDHEAIAGLRERRICLAVVHAQPIADVEQLTLWDERILLAVREDHHLAKQATTTWAEVRLETILVQGSGRSAALYHLQAALLGPGVPLRVQHAGLVDILNLVAIGEGVALISESHREISLPGVRYVEIGEVDARVGLVLAWSPTLEDPVAGSFVAFMRDWIRSHPKERSAASA